MPDQTSKAHPAGFAYRPEIDGLRSVAVLSVVLFHFSVPGFSGGFVGVDIFFVISGFLIGSILWREHAASGTISLTRFYLRRFRRLAPAYFAMAAVSLVVGYLVLLPFEFREFGKSLIASALYVSNIHFYRQSGYFDSGAEDKILLHTWSLSVEEQFYIFLPLAMLAFARFGRFFKPTLVLAALLSFALCLYVTGLSPPAGFYLFPFRAWELLVGVLLAVYGSRTGGIPGRGGALLSWLGLALLAGAVASIEPGDSFPGSLAAVPVLGTVLVILNGKDDNPVNRALSARVPVLVGLMSYSLYLWHWPVLTLSRYWRDGYDGPLEAAFWLLVAIAAAWLSWRFVETPVRRARRLPGPVLAGGVAMASAALVSAGGLLYLGNGLPGRFDPRVLAHVEASQDFIQDWSRCFVPDDGPLRGLETCPVGPAGRAPEFLAWGDSHLRAFKEGLDLAAREADRPGLVIWRAGCPPLFGLRKQESASTRQEDRDCAEATARLREALPQLATIRTMLLVGRWSYYAEGTGIGGDAHNTVALAPASGSGLEGDDQAGLFAAAAAATVEELARHGKAVMVLRQVPEIPDYHSGRVARRMAHGRLRPGPELERLTEVPRQALERRNAAAEAAFGPLAARKEITLLDSWPALCGAGTCSAMQAGRSLYFDNNHVTNTGARTLRGLFAPALAPPPAVAARAPELAGEIGRP